MLKLMKFGGVALTAGAVVGLSIVGWLYSHRLDSADTVTLHSPNVETPTGLSPNNLGSGTQATPGLMVATTDPGASQGAVLGASQGSVATPTASPSASSDTLPDPSNFKQYDTYKSDTSNVYSVDEQKGTGTAVKEGDKVVVRYTGWLTDGSVFDTTEKTGGKAAEFTLMQGQLISGWVVGLQGMQPGGVRRLIIPPAAGYGSTAQNGIPADSVLIFDVQLVSIQP